MCDATFLKSSDPIARKNHRCDWCGELILKGEKYSSVTSVQYGEIGTFKSHPECNKAASTLSHDELCESEPMTYKRGTTKAWDEEEA